MAYFKCDIASQQLGMSTQVTVTIPNDTYADRNRKCKVLYLLHGLSDNNSIWSRYTLVERYAMERGYVVIMPEVARSFYTDMRFGQKYFTYISKELPELMKIFFNISCDPKDTYIAGLSMGGYGALKTALTYPENFAGCAAFSGCVDIRSRVEQAEMLGMQEQFKSVFGLDKNPDDTEELYYLAKKLNENKEINKPIFLTTCGYDDFLYQDNLKFRDFMQTLDIKYEYHEWEGNHNWTFWDASIKLAMDYFDRNRD